MKKIWILFFAILSSVFFTSTLLAGVSEMADSLIKAHNEKQLTPVLSKANPGLDVKTAYQIQKAYVQRRMAKDTVAGFKAGLTTEGAQKTLGVTSPVSGVLYGSGKLEGSPVINGKDFRALGIETEIGFVIGQPISRPIESTQEFKKMISAVMPAIELPDLGFAGGMKEVKGVDLIAANVGAAKFIAGAPKSYQGENLDQVNVTLLYNGQALYQGKGVEAMGDQWKTALWLVNSAVEQGYKLEPGNILITGALGKLTPGKPGQYVADYGDFGKISFEVK